MEHASWVLLFHLQGESAGNAEDMRTIVTGKRKRNDQSLFEQVKEATRECGKEVLVEVRESTRQQGDGRQQ